MVRDALLSIMLLFSFAYVGDFFTCFSSPPQPPSFFSFFLLPSQGGLLALLCAVWHPALRKNTYGSRRWWEVFAWSFTRRGPAHRKQSVWRAGRGDCTTWARPRTPAVSEPVGRPSLQPEPPPALAGAPGQRKAPDQALCVLRGDYEWSTITGSSTPFTKIYKL